MKVLLDHNLPKRLRQFLPGHDVKTAREMGWDALKNGALIRSAAHANFQALLSADKNLRHEHNLSLLPLAVIVLECVSNALPALIPFTVHVQTLLSVPLRNGLYVVRPDGTIDQPGVAGSP